MRVLFWHQSRQCSGLSQHGHRWRCDPRKQARREGGSWSHSEKIHSWTYTCNVLTIPPSPERRVHSQGIAMYTLPLSSVAKTRSHRFTPSPTQRLGQSNSHNHAQTRQTRDASALFALTWTNPLLNMNTSIPFLVPRLRSFWSDNPEKRRP